MTYRGLQLKNVLREVFGCFRRAAQSAQCELVGPGCAAQPKVNAAWKQSRQRPELFGDDVGCMVGEHDAARADPDCFCSGCDMTNHNRRCSARNAWHVVMLRHPNAAIAPSLGMDRNITGIVECGARVDIFGNADEIEDRQSRHRNSRTNPFSQNDGLRDTRPRLNPSAFTDGLMRCSSYIKLTIFRKDRAGR